MTTEHPALGRDSARRAARGARSARSARGASLLEALVGVLVLGAGLLGTAHWQQRLREAAHLAAEHDQALQRARSALEQLRLGDAPAGAPAGPPAGADDAFSVSTSRLPTAWPQAHALGVRIGWLDRTGAPRQLRLDTLHAPEPPGAVLALLQPTVGHDAGHVRGRHAGVPRAARPLGAGRSLLKPLADGDLAWRFDDRSGRLVAQCRVDPARALPTLTADDLHDCQPTDAVLLSGRLRTAPPLDTAALAQLRPAVAVLRSDGVPPAKCAVGPAPPDAPGDGRPIAGTAATDEPQLQYWCAIAPLATPDPAADPAVPGLPRWSGRLQVTLPPAPDDPTWTVCRFSADTDGSGAIDRPAEFPPAWEAVRGALPEQNLLLVADGPCPAGTPSDAAQGLLPWWHANPATVAQPP